MSIQSIDARFRSTIGWRAIGFLSCCWFAGVIVLVGMSAINDGVELYRWTMLLLLLVGVPVLLSAIAYAGSLLGIKGCWIAAWVVFVLVAAFALHIANTLHREEQESQRNQQLRDQAREQRREERRMTMTPEQITEQTNECIKKCTAGDEGNKYCRPICEDP